MKLLLSFLIVALGQPSWISVMGPLAAGFGYALFWKWLQDHPTVPTALGRFWRGGAWYAAVHAVQLSWIATTEYQGYYILLVYALLISALGVVFGAFCIALPKRGALHPFRIGAFAGAWVLMEWGRMHFLCGFSWNPAGMALCSTSYSMQMASLFGVLGLSFWVIFSNLLSLNCFYGKSKTLAVCVIALPYLFGYAQIQYHTHRHPQDANYMNVALVHTALSPPQKIPLERYQSEFIPPLKQWSRLFRCLKQGCEMPLDLIVLPESALPFGAMIPLYPFEEVCSLVGEIFGQEALKSLPTLQPPYAIRVGTESFVCNAFMAQILSNIYRSELIAGFDDQDMNVNKYYNAAFHFFPQEWKVSRYEKQILLPIAEYLPFPWVKKLAATYGITDFFSHGDTTKIFNSKPPLSLSICYEETFPYLMRRARKRGSELFVNVTSDSWYPDSRLPQQHFEHGRLRTVENGIPLLRACNVGITAAIDSLGRSIAQVSSENEQILLARLPLYHYKTLYSYWGDRGIVGLSLFLILIFLERRGRLKFI